MQERGEVHPEKPHGETVRRCEEDPIRHRILESKEAASNVVDPHIAAQFLEKRCDRARVSGLGESDDRLALHFDLAKATPNGVHVRVALEADAG